MALHGHRKNIHDDEGGNENTGNLLELVHLLANLLNLRKHLVEGQNEYRGIIRL